MDRILCCRRTTRLCFHALIFSSMSTTDVHVAAQDCQGCAFVRSFSTRSPQMICLIAGKRFQGCAETHKGSDVYICCYTTSWPCICAFILSSLTLMNGMLQENNFKAVLESIRDLMNEDTVMPDWLHDIFLGYGDPAQAKYTHMPQDQLLQTIDFKASLFPFCHILLITLANSLNGQDVVMHKQCCGHSFSVTYICTAANSIVYMSSKISQTLSEPPQCNYNDSCLAMQQNMLLTI